jgi:putative spermidine/putrescine transport system substrate-binding protein
MLRRLVAMTAVVVAAPLMLTACGGGDNSKDSTDPSAPGNAAAAKSQAQEFYTVGMPDDWSNYGQFWQTLCDTNSWGCNGFASTGAGAGSNRTDNDDASSADVITEFADKNATKDAVCGDVGIAFTKPLQDSGAGLKYVPAGTDKIPPTYHASDDSWWATMTGVPTFLVNVDKVKNPPKTWADLAKPEYKGLIAIKDPTESGTAQAMVLAAAFSYFNQLQDAGQFNEAGFDESTFESGETPIFIGYDFSNIATMRAMQKVGVHATVTVPEDGSIYAPSATVCNANTSKTDLAKYALDFAFSDKGQQIFAEAGAHPIRYVLGDLTLPASAKKNWLPESEYANVEQFDGDSWPAAAEIAQRWNDEVINK